jgi:hypothetical protein
MATGIPVVPAAQRLVDCDRPRAEVGRPGAGFRRPRAGLEAAGAAAPARPPFGRERPWPTPGDFRRAHSCRVPATFRLRGKPGFQARLYVFSEPRKRHTLLRTRYCLNGDAAVIPGVGRAQPFIAQIINVPSGSEEECTDLLAKRVKTPFDHDYGWAMRADWLRIADTLLAGAGTGPE